MIKSKFKRRKPIQYHTDELKTFVRLVNEGIELSGFYEHINNYPYDCEHTKEQGYRKCKTLHITFRHRIGADIDDIIDSYVQEGFETQTNPRTLKSIPEIEHIHFIKVLSYE